MQSISQFMVKDHTRCDELYAEGEALLLNGSAEEGKQKMEAFTRETRLHFDMEEKVLFPTFEQATGMTQGPTMVMRMEHQQTNAVMDQIQESLDEGDTETALGAGETLLLLMQQHNMKEEGMLYPMTDQHLGGQSDEVIERMKEVS